MGIVKSKGIAKAVIQLLTVLVLAGAMIFVTITLTRDKEPEITSTFIDSKLETVSALTASKLTYNGLVFFSDGKIPFLTKKAFTMTYRAEVRAGIDLAQVSSEVTETVVTITLPAVEIQDISVDTDSIHYFDEKFALFNGEKKEDALAAIQAAKTDVQENGGMDELKTAAKAQIEVLLTGLFTDSIGARTLEVRFR